MIDPIKIVLIEDHAMVRGLVARVAEDAFAQAVVSLARDGASGIQLCREVQPMLVLLDLELPDVDGFELIHQIREVAPSVRILVISSHTEDYVLHRVQQASVEGFVDKNEHSPQLLAEALRTVAAGQPYYSMAVEKAMRRFRTNPLAFPKLLSEREQNLLRFFGQGLSDDKIAESIGLAEITVRNHRWNIMSRLGIHTTPDLIRYALGNGFARVRAGD